jgi:thiamine pyrophosphate-dependent acetolactate synthase large subunit-like protein
MLPNNRLVRWLSALNNSKKTTILAGAGCARAHRELIIERAAQLAHSELPVRADASEAFEEVERGIPTHAAPR